MTNARRSSRLFAPRTLTFAIISLALSVTPIAFGMVNGAFQRHEVAVATIGPEIGANFITPLPPLSFWPRFGVDVDDPQNPKQSTARLYEDRRELGPAHSDHASIRSAGGGRFSHWGANLYFSASDNSDPRTNGRAYALVTNARLAVDAVRFWALLFVTSLIVGLWRRSRTAAWKGAARRSPVSWLVAA